MCIYVPEFRYADLETMALESRATQRTGVSQKDTGLWVGDKLCASAAKASSTMRRSMAIRLRGDSYPLLSAGGTHPGSVCGLGLPGQARVGGTAASPGKDHRDN